MTVKATNKKKNTKKEPKRSVGRPKFIIDYKLSQQLAEIGCTQDEIASIQGCSVDTLQRDQQFCGVYKKGLSNCKMSLRRKQIEVANSGNATMLVWLGKQLLGQTDKQEINHGGGVKVIQDDIK